MSMSTINRYLSGEVEPTLAAAVKLANCLNVSELWLRGYDVPKNRAPKTENDEDFVPEDNSFARRLLYALVNANMTRAELSQRTGISQSMIDFYLNGHFQPKMVRVYRISKVLGVSEEWLLGYVDSKNRAEEQKTNNTPHTAITFSAQRLREALNNAGMTQGELARRTGLNKGTISHYLSGSYVPKQKAMSELAYALNVSEAWLMGDTENKCRTTDQKKD